jgi:hypothetical protein
MEIFLYLLAIFIVAVIVLFGFAWTIVMLAFSQPGIHDDLLLDGEDFDRKSSTAKGNVR